MKLIAYAIVAVLTLFAARVFAAETGADDAALKTELLRLEQERQDAYVAGDRAVLERQFAAEYVHTNLHGGKTDRAQELDFYKPGVFSLEDGEISDVTVHRYGDVATLIGVVEWKNATYRPKPGASVDLSGRFAISRVYVRRDERWLLALSHASKLP